MSLLTKVKNKYRRLNRWYKSAWKPENMFGIPFPVKVIYALRGFNSNEYVWYDLEHNDYREYISEFERILSRDINGEYKNVLDDKIVFSEIVGQYIKVPDTIAWIKNGIVYGLHGKNIDNDNLLEEIRNYKDVVVKWEKGYEGKGTFIIHYDGKEFVVNKKSCSSEEVINIIFSYSNSIICEFMHQCEFEEKLYPGSTNTIRIICAKRSGEKKARIISAVQRIGTNDSAPVDNVSAGALAALIDIESGKLESAIQAKSKNKDKLFVRYNTHPDSGAKIADEIVPDWERIKEKILDLTNKLPYLNFVAWDILITTDGICAIEGNSSAGLMMLQVHSGVRNTEIGNIYRSYRIIK